MCCINPTFALFLDRWQLLTIEILRWHQPPNSTIPCPSHEELTMHAFNLCRIVYPNSLANYVEVKQGQRVLHWCPWVGWSSWSSLKCKSNTSPQTKMN